MKIAAVVHAAGLAELEAAQLRSKLDEVKELALAANLAYLLQIPPSLVGIHPGNRSGWGCSGTDMQKLGHDIVVIGWSNAETLSAICFEDLPDGRGAKFTEGLQKQSEQLPQQSEQSIRFVALACTHTNQFLLAVQQGVRCSLPVIGENGHMSKAKILEKCPRMADPLEKGLQWFVFKHICWSMVPKLPWLIQTAANKPGAIHRKPTMFQTLTGMQSDISEQLSTGTLIVDQTAILRNAAKQSDHLEDLPGLLAWALAYGGGRSGFWTDELCTFVKENCRPDCYVPGSIFKAVAGWALPADNRCERAATAIIKMVAEKNDPRCVRDTEVKKLAASDTLLSADEALKTARLLCSDQRGGCEASDCWFQVCWFQVGFRLLI